MIVGRSIHNQRIKRLWRDVFQGALKFYYGLFYHLESMGILGCKHKYNMQMEFGWCV